MSTPYVIYERDKNCSNEETSVRPVDITKSQINYGQDVYWFFQERNHDRNCEKLGMKKSSRIISRPR